MDTNGWTPITENPELLEVYKEKGEYIDLFVKRPMGSTRFPDSYYFRGLWYCGGKPIEGEITHFKIDRGPVPLPTHQPDGKDVG